MMGSLSTLTMRLTILAITIAVIQCLPISRKSSYSITDTELENNRQKRSDANSQHETKLALVINNKEESLKSDLEETNFHRTKRSSNSDGTAIKSRTRRHVAQKELHSHDRQHNNTPLRRQRRSAAWFLSAAIKLCDNHPSLCRRIEVEEKDIKLTVRFEES